MTQTLNAGLFGETEFLKIRTVAADTYCISDQYQRTFSSHYWYPNYASHSKTDEDRPQL